MASKNNYTALQKEHRARANNTGIFLSGKASPVPAMILSYRALKWAFPDDWKAKNLLPCFKGVFFPIPSQARVQNP